MSERVTASRAGEMTREIEAALQARERAVADAEERARRRLDDERRAAEATLEGARLKATAIVRLVMGSAALTRRPQRRVLIRPVRGRVLMELLPDDDDPE